MEQVLEVHPRLLYELYDAGTYAHIGQRCPTNDDVHLNLWCFHRLSTDEQPSKQHKTPFIYMGRGVRGQEVVAPE